MSKENIKICVRVRPFNSFETGETCIVSMEGNQTSITNPKDGKDLKYKFNRCFWSHANTGGKKIFTNKDLFNDVGVELLTNSYSGFNSTIFAYGQTGSGKSYSIEGSASDQGLLQ